MSDVWKDVKGYEGLYKISPLGEIKTVSRYVNVSHRGFTGKRLIKEKVMKFYTNRFGYDTVMLRRNGTDKQYMVHRLVAQTFIPNPDNLPCVNHKDENKRNNVVSNLEWCSYSYNDNYGNRNINISKSRKGMKFSEEHIKNLRIAGKKRVTDEFREKMRQVHLGTKLSEEHKRKISNGVKRAKKSNMIP